MLRLSKTVQWEPVKLKGQGPPTRRCSSFDKTRMDLDNDGQEDLVVKATFCMKGAPSDSLYVFPADSTVLEQASWQDTQSACWRLTISLSEPAEPIR